MKYFQLARGTIEPFVRLRAVALLLVLAAFGASTELGAVTIYSTSASTISLTGASLSWVTDQTFYSPYSCYASYGPTAAYGSTSLTTTGGIVGLTGLPQGAVTHYSVVCTDGATTTSSPDATFTTLASLPQTPPARTVIDNDSLVYFDTQAAMPGAIIQPPYSTLLAPAEVDPLAIKGAHSLFHWAGGADQHRLAFVPYDELTAFNTEEQNAGRPALLVTAEQSGTHYPVIADTDGNNCYNAKQLFSLQDPRLVRFIANEHGRKVLVSPVFPDVTDSPYYQSAVMGSDEGTFEYNVMDIYPGGCGSSGVLPSVWDSPFPQNEVQFLNAVASFNYQLANLAPDLGVIVNEAAEPDTGFSSNLNTNTNLANWANTFGTFFGIDHEAMLNWLSTPDFTRHAIYQEMYNWSWQIANGGLFFGRLPISAQNATQYQNGAIAYLMVRGGNSFFGEETNAGSVEVDPSNYTPIFDALGAATAAFTTIQNGANIWDCVFSRTFQGGIALFNYSGSSYTYTLPSTLNGSNVTTWYLNNTSTSYAAGATYSIPDTSATNPTAAGGVYFTASQSGTYVSAPTYYPPTFGRVLTAPVPVTLSDTTSGAAIHYTLDGTTPTCSSPTYSTALELSTSTTVKAIGCLGGDITSWVKTAAYALTPALPSAQFHLATDSAPPFYTNTYAEIHLSNPTAATVSITYMINASANVTASPTSGTLTFRPYETDRAIYINAALNSGNSGTVTATLTGSTNAVLGLQTTYVYTIQADAVTSLEQFANLHPSANAEVVSTAAMTPTDTSAPYFYTGTNGPNGARYRSLWRFDLTQIPSNAAVISARIKGYYPRTTDGSGAGTITVSAYRMTSSWTQTGATWNNSGGNSANFASMASSTMNQAISQQVDNPTEPLDIYWDVTADVQAMLGGAVTNYGWVLVGPESPPSTCGTGGTGSGSSLCTEFFNTYNNNYVDGFGKHISGSIVSLLVTYTVPTGMLLQPTVSLAGPASAVYASTFVLTPVSNSGATPTIVVTGGPCQMSGANVTMTAGTGTCQLQATWPATSVYTGATASLSVAAAPILVLPSVTVANKNFDATTVAAIAGCSLSNVLPADAGNITCGAASATFAFAGVDNNIPVTVSGITLSGSAVANYALSTTTAATTANITFLAPPSACIAAPAYITAWWKAEGNANDVTGLYNATLGGDTTFAAGKVGQAFSFDGSQSPYVALPAGAFPTEPSATPFTLETWFQTSATSGGVILGSQSGTPYGGVPGGSTPAIYVGVDGSLYAQMFSSTSGITPVVSPIPVNDGQWHHVAVTYDGSTETVYLDGASIGTIASFTQASNGTPPYYQLGTGYTGSGWPAGNNGWFTFDGLIDETTVYSRALSAAEVTAIVQAETYGKCNPVASLSAASLAFLSVTQGQSASLPVQISNPGNAPLTITSISLDSGDTNFTVLGGTDGDCAVGTAVAPNASCNVRVQFAPQAGGTLSGQITVTDNSLYLGGVQRIALSGSELTAQTIAFGAIPSQLVNTSLPLSATATSSLPVSFASSTPSICAVSGTTASLLAAGTCIIVASQAGNMTYGQATPVTQTFNVLTSESITVGGTTNTSFGSVNVCPASPCSQASTLTLNVAASDTFGTPIVVTDGLPNLDFTLASGSTCTGTVTGGSTCTVNVAFTPQFPGLVKGAVEIVDGGGHIVGTTLISGIGAAPQIDFGPGAAATLAFTGLNNPLAIAVDAVGDVFVGDYDNRVLELPASGGPVTTVPASGINRAFGIAVDGAGDVFIADYYNKQVVEEPSGGGAQVTLPLTGLQGPRGLAVDGTGDVFVSDVSNQVFEVPAGGCPAAGCPTIGSGWNNPGGLAVDAAGDLFVADSGSGRVLEVSAGSGQTTTVASGFSGQVGIAVDAAGDVFVADTGNNRVLEVPVGGCPTAGCPQLGSGLSGPWGVAVDRAGNVYIADTSNSRVLQLQRAQAPTLSFQSTPVGSTSSDSPQSVTVQNTGNLPLVATGLSVGTNFAQVPGSGTPADCTSSSSLAPGASCDLSLSFEPQNAGSLMGAAVLTDNALNVPGAVQSIALGGTGSGAAPAITSTASTTFIVGGAGSFTVTATGFPAPTFAETGALPSGVTLTSGGLLSGTPAANTGGTYRITITASNGVGSSATQAFTLTIDQAPAITSAASAIFTVGAAGSFTVTATGFPAPTFTETGTLPTGVTLTSGGLLSGTPAAGTNGTYPITITASNGVGANATQAFTLTIGQAPAVTSAASTTFTVGAAGSFTVTATGFPAPTFAETGALPSGVTLTPGGLLSGTPAANTGGTYRITITASNGVGSNATQAFTLTIDQAPTITSAPSTTFTVGAAGSFTVTATGFPAPTFTKAGTLPKGLTFKAGLLSGTPAASTGGTYALTITASNGVGSNATQAFTLTIDQAPAITSAAKTTFTVGTAGSFTVTATGLPAPTFSTGTLPSGVTLTSSGLLSGIPAASTGGTHAITITASNGVGSNATQAFTLTIDQAPAITSAAKTTFTVGTAGSFKLTATGFPAPTFTETGALPSGVTLTSAGLLSGTSAAGTSGTYPITITASNGVGSNATQAFTLTIGQAPAITSAASTTFTAGAAGSFTVTATGFPAPTFSTGTLPSGVTLTSGGLLSGTPAAGTGGTHAITITASNGVGSNATQAFTLTIDQAPAITSAAKTTFTVGTAGSFKLTATGFPAPTFAETGALPTGVTLTSAGLLSGTPAAGTGGTYPITITASNGVGANATQAFTLTIDQAPAITSPASTTFTVGAAGSFTVTATGFPAPTFAKTGTLPSGLTLTSGGLLSGTPAAGTGGTHAITITASNGVGSNATQAFTLTIDQAPAITSAAKTTFTVGTAGSFGLTATGFPAPTFAETGALPTGVTLTSAGLLSGTPAANTGGTYAITITASNGVGSIVTQAFTLTIDQAPAITSAASTTFTVGAAGSFKVTATGFPAPTFTETGTLPKGLTFKAGLLSGTPAAGTNGTYPITITASNGVGANATQSFTLTIN